MKNTFLNAIAVIFGLILFPNCLFGQLYEVSLDEKIQKSSLIVEGKIVESKCYLADNGNIYTANKIKLSALIKGDYREQYLSVTTWGGELDGDLQTWTHLLTLKQGEQGIFFLENTQAPTIIDAAYPLSFDVFSGAQGFIKFVQNDSKAWIGKEPFHTYTDIQNELYGYIERQTGQKRVALGPGGDGIRSGIRYHFADIGFQGNSVTFNIYVNSLQGTKKLYKSGIQLGYNPAFFGSNIATNGNLLLQDAGISQLSSYDLSQNDVTSSKVKIELLPVGTLTGLTEINTSEQLLARGRITIQNLLADPGITYDIAEMQAMSKFYEAGFAHVFDTVMVEGSWRLTDLLPEIITINPKIVTGGTDETITIEGNNFGTYLAGESNVWFYNARTGANPLDIVEPLPGDYNLWENNKIIVQVPSYIITADGLDYSREDYAGTGLIQVCDGNGNCSTPTPLDLVTVKYSVFNDRTASSDMPASAGLASTLRNANGEKGISIKFSPDFDADIEAKAAVIRAINTWKCTTKVNWNTDAGAPDNDNTDMGLVYYDALPIGTTSATWAAAPNTINKCKDLSSGVYLHAYQVTFKVAFNKNVTFWHKPKSLTGFNNTKIDMQSVAVHEFGHTHNLNHVNNETEVMYWYISTGVVKRNLLPNDAAGGNWVMAKTVAIVLNSDCPVAMEPADISGLDCSSNGAYYLTGTEDIIAYPNPVENFLFIQIPESNLTAHNIEVYAMNGQKELKSVVSGLEIREGTPLDTSQLPVGIYMVRIEIAPNFFSMFKIVKQ